MIFCGILFDEEKLFDDDIKKVSAKPVQLFFYFCDTIFIIDYNCNFFVWAYIFYAVYPAKV